MSEFLCHQISIKYHVGTKHILVPSTYHSQFLLVYLKLAWDSSRKFPWNCFTVGKNPQLTLSIIFSSRGLTHHAWHRPRPPGRTMGPLLRPLRMCWRHREIGTQQATRALHTCWQMGVRNRSGPTPCQRQTSAARDQFLSDSVSFKRLWN